jgi:rhamnosyltransferase
MRIGLAIPTLNADRDSTWLDTLTAIFERQSLLPESTVVIDSGSKDRTVEMCRSYPVQVHEIPKARFDHGGTRNLALDLLGDVDIAIFLTQDSEPNDPETFQRIVDGILSGDKIAATFGRQIPRHNASLFAKHARLYNYPASSRSYSLEDRTAHGLKTIFLSNSFSAYRVDFLRSVGGFSTPMIFGEDMLAAAKLLKAGKSIFYNASAVVRHSHNYTLAQEFSRYFDVAVFYSQNSWLRKEFGGASVAGRDFVASELNYLKTERAMALPEAIARTCFKYSGYLSGKRSHALPNTICRKLSMNKGYWDQTPDRNQLNG